MQIIAIVHTTCRYIRCVLWSDCVAQRRTRTWAAFHVPCPCSVVAILRVECAYICIPAVSDPNLHLWFTYIVVSALFFIGVVGLRSHPTRFVVITRFTTTVIHSPTISLVIFANDTFGISPIRRIIGSGPGICIEMHLLPMVQTTGWFVRRIYFSDWIAQSRTTDGTTGQISCPCSIVAMFGVQCTRFTVLETSNPNLHFWFSCCNPSYCTPGRCIMIDWSYPTCFVIIRFATTIVHSPS